MYDIITIGTATRDVFLTSLFFKVFRDTEHLKKNGFPTGEAQCFTLGGKVEIDKPIFTTGGGATNAATTFSRQGLKTAALVKIGEDKEGEDIVNEMAKEKITAFAIKDENKGTAHSTILLSTAGERTILVYRGASGDLTTDEIPFKKIKAKWAYIAPSNIAFVAMEKIFNYLYENGVLIAFNPSKYYIELGIDKLKPFLEKSKAVILNREEASYLTGVDYQNEREIFKKLDEITPGIVVMTDGPNGVMVSDGANIYQSGIFKDQKVVDRTGAGDAFGSGFVAGLAHKRENCEKGLCRTDNIEYAIRLASANATSVVEQIGAKKGILTKEEFEKDKRWENFQIKREII